MVFTEKGLLRHVQSKYQKSEYINVIRITREYAYLFAIFSCVSQEDKNEETKKTKEDMIKKEEDKKESKPETLPKEIKKEINQAPNKIEDKKPVNIITSSQNSSIKSRMTLFENKFNDTLQNNRINPPVIKRVQTTNILSNPKFSDLAKKMSDKLQTGPIPRQSLRYAKETSFWIQSLRHRKNARPQKGKAKCSIVYSSRSNRQRMERRQRRLPETLQ